MQSERNRLRRRLADLEQRDREREHRRTRAICDLVIQWADSDPKVAAIMDQYGALVDAQTDPPTGWPPDRATRELLARTAAEHQFDRAEADEMRVEFWKITQASGAPEARSANTIFERAKRDIVARERVRQ